MTSKPPVRSRQLVPAEPHIRVVAAKQPPISNPKAAAKDEHPSDRPGYFRILYAFLTLSSVFLGPSLWFKGWRPLMYIQYVCILALTVSSIALYAFLLPDYDYRCCYKPHVTRELGSCKDELSTIFSQVVGHSKVKQECTSYPTDIRVFIAIFWLSLVSIIVLHCLQIHEGSEKTDEAIGKFTPLISGDNSHPKEKAETYDAILFVASICSGEADSLYITYLLPESFLFGYPLIAYHGILWCVCQFLLTVIPATCFWYFFAVYRMLWEAWCCYPQDESVLHYDKGLCSGPCPREHVKSYIPIIIASVLLVLKIFSYRRAYVTTKSYYLNPEKYIVNYFPLVSKELLLNIMATLTKNT